MTIYQMLMMLWEAILENWFLVAMLITLLSVLWLYWLIKRKQKIFNHRRSAWFALAIAILGFFFLPLYFSATLFDLSYWVDWAFHLTMVVALLFYSYLVCLPLTATHKAIK